MKALAATAATILLLGGLVAFSESIPLWNHLASAIGAYALLRFLVKTAAGFDIETVRLALQRYLLTHESIRSAIARAVESFASEMARDSSHQGTAPAEQATGHRAVELPSLPDRARPPAKSPRPGQTGKGSPGSGHPAAGHSLFVAPGDFGDGVSWAQGLVPPIQTDARHQANGASVPPPSPSADDA